MIDKHITPQVMCSACGHIFPSPAKATDDITCPECQTLGKPKGIMQPSGFPSLDTFKRNWQKSKSESLMNSSEENQE